MINRNSTFLNNILNTRDININIVDYSQTYSIWITSKKYNFEIELEKFRNMNSTYRMSYDFSQEYI